MTAEQQDRTLDVLLIEDNPGDARLIEFMLREASETAVRLAARAEPPHRQHRAPGAIVVRRGPARPLAARWPGGAATFERLHAAAPDVPVVVLSGLSDETVAVQAVAAGAQDYLVPKRARRWRHPAARPALRGRAPARRTGAPPPPRPRAGRPRPEAERLASERAAILGGIADGC